MQWRQISSLRVQSGYFQRRSIFGHGLRIRVNLPHGLLVSVAREGNVEELWNGDGWRHVSRNFFRSFYLAEKGLWSGAGLCLKRWASLSSYIQQHYVEQERW